MGEISTHIQSMLLPVCDTSTGIEDSGVSVMSTSGRLCDHGEDGEAKASFGVSVAHWS